MVEVKIKNDKHWSVTNGYLKANKWYPIEELWNGETYTISGEDSEHGFPVFLNIYQDIDVEVREVLKLEVGKKYVTKGGVVVGPMVKSDRGWVDQSGNKDEFEDDRDCVYSGSGKFIYGDEEDCENIVSEYVEEFHTIEEGFRALEIKIDGKSVEEYVRVFYETLEESKHNPVEEVTVKRLKAGTYGRLKLSTDGYHAINIRVVDGGRTWSKDDIEQAIETLTKIKDAR